ncbi:Uma2 family endonuclease [Trichothermofontia sp.]
MSITTLNLQPIVTLTDDQFETLCQANPEVKFERNATGELIIVSPTGGITGHCNFEIAAEFAIWNRQKRLGICFDSSTCFRLPNGADRSPDIAWIAQARWDTLTPEQQTRFPPICPDFVLELMSPSDRLSTVQEKMREYRENGARLGWLINPNERQVEVYRQAQAEVTLLQNPSTLSGEEVLPDFVLNLSLIWQV